MKGFAIIKKHVLYDKNLSLESKGLYAILYTKDGTTLSIKSISQELGEKEDKIIKLLNELKKYGYLKKGKDGNIYLY